MRFCVKTVLLLLVLSTAILTGFAQLRRPSEYMQDRINPEKTFFVLHDSGTAEFGWASEWTMYTSMDHVGQSAGGGVYSRGGRNRGAFGRCRAVGLAGR